MTQPPVSQSPFDKVIKAAASVKTRGGFAALNLVLVFLAFLFVLFLMTGLDRMILGILMFLLWQGFAVFVLFSSGARMNRPKGNDIETDL